MAAGGEATYQVTNANLYLKSYLIFWKCNKTITFRDDEALEYRKRNGLMSPFPHHLTLDLENWRWRHEVEMCVCVCPDSPF